jgi:hypothetical protein
MIIWKLRRSFKSFRFFVSPCRRHLGTVLYSMLHSLQNFVFYPRFLYSVLFSGKELLISLRDDVSGVNAIPVVICSVELWIHLLHNARYVSSFLIYTKMYLLFSSSGVTINCKHLVRVLYCCGLYIRCQRR